MKFLLLPLLAAAAGGIGGYGLAPRAEDAPASPCNAPSNCRMTIECTDRGTCLVTCFNENGQECCRQEVECDRECDSPCEGTRTCSPK